MANERDQRSWAARDAKLERHGLAEWQRASRTEDQDPLADLLGELGGSAPSAAILRQFMLFCLPPKSYGDRRRFRSGFYRMVAFAWRVAPELLDGCHEDKDVAERLGISRPALCKHLATVDAILSRGNAVVPKMGKSRVLPAAPLE